MAATFDGSGRVIGPALVALLLSCVAVAAETPVGIWENQRTKSTVEFRPNGDVLMSGLGTSTFQDCAGAGGNICIVGKGFNCRYRAIYTENSMTLQLFTGRPTKNCPEGVYHRKSE